MTIPSLKRCWVCARGCGAQARTVDGKLPHHRCPQMAGLMAPLVQDGTRAKVEAVDRGDYVGRELVQTDQRGRPVMAVVTTRDDGQDCTVFVPCATAETE